MPRSPEQEVLTKQREADCVRLRLEGRSFDEIARTVGYSNRGGALKSYRRGLQRIGMEHVEEMLELNKERYDAMLCAVWPKVQRGDLTAISRALMVVDQMNRLVGLDRPRCACGTNPSSGQH